MYADAFFSEGSGKKCGCKWKSHKERCHLFSIIYCLSDWSLYLSTVCCPVCNPSPRQQKYYLVTYFHLNYYIIFRESSDRLGYWTGMKKSYMMEEYAQRDPRGRNCKWTGRRRVAPYDAIARKLEVESETNHLSKPGVLRASSGNAAKR